MGEGGRILCPPALTNSKMTIKRRKHNEERHKPPVSAASGNEPGNNDPGNNRPTGGVEYFNYLWPLLHV